MSIDTGDTAWVLVSSALVLLMTPGLALFYGGMARRKNLLSTIMMSFAVMGLIGILWALWGYSLAFGGDNPWFGNGEFLFMREVARDWNEGETFTDANGNGQYDEGEEFDDANENSVYDSPGPIEPMEGAIRCSGPDRHTSATTPATGRPACRRPGP